MVTLVPAYGRDYKSKKEVIKDWEENKDFIIQTIGHPYDGKVANRSDLAGESVKIRYNNLRNVAVIN